MPDLHEYRGACALAVLLAWFVGSALWFRLSKLRLGLAVLGAVIGEACARVQLNRQAT